MASVDNKIAIVGMSCRFPGGAHNPAAFWHLLQSGISTAEEIPPSRFNIDDYWAEKGETNKMMARQGHFLQEGTMFDESFFNISPRESLNTDPQHRVLLEAVVDALDDAGYKPGDAGGEAGWIKSRTGVFVGCATDSYQNNLASDIDAFFCPGTIRGFASGRISHHFGWQGPSLVYDTACSSGLVAVHAACQSLVLNECDAAIASGTNMLTSPEMFIGLSKGFFISNTGGCRTFDETADGYCRAEGVGVLVLKRLADAIRDNDKIDAVILASGVNQSGPTESLTTPHSPSQAMLFTENCIRANISPLAVRVVEAHGTGTQAGDFSEIEAIKHTYCHGRSHASSATNPTEEKTLFVTSLKPNVGHSESASGLASVIKAVLMMKHNIILPHKGITTKLNPRLGNLAAHNIVIPVTPQPLQPISGYNNVYVSVNNFGAPGGNANIILQDNPMVSTPNEKDPRTYHIISISAKTHTPFSIIIERLLEHLKNTTEDIDLGSLSYTTTARRIDYPSRLAFSVSSIEELKAQLGRSTSPVVRAAKVPRIGFVIGGNGSQYKAMGKTLYETSTVFRTNIDHCDQMFKTHGDLSILGVIAGDVDPFILNEDSLLATTGSIFAIGYALGMMWKEWGVTPSVLIGHSLGEFAGLVLAGCLTVDDAVKLLVCRTRSLCAPDVVSLDGGMLVIGVPAEDVSRLLDQSECSNLHISCYNGPTQTCVSGPRLELLKLQAFTQNLPEPPLVKLLPGQFAWHSPQLSYPAEELQKAAEDITFNEAKTTVILNAAGLVLHPGQAPSASYFARQIITPVRFDLCTSHALAQDIDIWIELSAKTILLPLLRQLVPSGKVFLQTLGGPDTDCWSSITKVLARLYENHVPINWYKYHEPYSTCRLLSLPSYPFARNEHWVPYQDRLHTKHVTSPGSSVHVNNDRRHDIVSTPIGPLEIVKPWKHYIVHMAVHYLHPGIYIWLALSCTSYIKSKQVTNLQVTGPSKRQAYLTVIVESFKPDRFIVKFIQHDDENSLGYNLIVASCEVESGSFSPAGFEKILEHSRKNLMNNSMTSNFSKTTASRMLTASMGTFADNQALESIIVSDDGCEAVGQIRLDNSNVPLEVEHPSVSAVPFSPAQLGAFLQPICLSIFLNSGAVSSINAYSIDHFVCTEGLGEIAISKPTLWVHTFLDMSNGGQLVKTQSYIHSQDGSILARVSGFRRVDLMPDLTEGTISSSPSLSIESAVVSSSVPSPVSSSTATATPTKDSSEEKLDLTESAIITILAQELGIPAQSISTDDLLEAIGVDSILSLLIRDKISKLIGYRLEWFNWKRGISVQDLSGHIMQNYNSAAPK